MKPLLDFYSLFSVNRTIPAVFLAFLGCVFALEAKEVSVLTVGNSFANNALTYLPELAEAAGHEVIVARANLGGCSFERHWSHASAFLDDPESEEGSPYQDGTRSLDSLLQERSWDYITVQQVSYKSHDLRTFYPYAPNLVAFIRERAPGSQIMLHQIWAYRVDDPWFISPNEDENLPTTQKEMFERIRKNNHRIADELDLEILPSGDAMYLADTNSEWGFKSDPDFDAASMDYPNLPEQPHSLHIGWIWRKRDDGSDYLRYDGHHAGVAGRYLTGCVWFEAFFGESVVSNAFVPEGLDPNYAAFLRKTAHEAVVSLTTYEN